MIAEAPTLEERVRGSRPLAARQRFARRLCRTMGRVRTSGLASIPSTGPVILAVNHQSLMDGPLVFGFVERPVSCLVKAEAFEPMCGLAGRALVKAAQIPVRRGTIDPKPVHLMLSILDAGGVVGIFPEGTRGDGSVRTARPGVGYLALKTGAPVVPIAISGSAAMTHHRDLRRPAVSVVAGEPLRLSAAAVPGTLRRTDWTQAAEQVRAQLAALVAQTTNNNAGPATVVLPEREVQR